MSQRHTGTRVANLLQFRWVAGAVSGLIAGVGMGTVFHAGANLMPFIGALYGWPTVVGGWVVHLVNSVVAGLLFAVIISRPILREQTASTAETVAAGVVYAAAIGLVSTGILLPISMNVLGVQSFPEPLVPLPGMLGTFLVIVSVGVAHLVYGLILGTAYARVKSYQAPETTVAGG
ncbi:hypothetical protein SAMN05443574_106147 [Haloarcula vallismortis]|uniref:Histidine kinase n=2 Tax=Haloarcula vallismortis TaxID=28442 RepID=M0JET3_HALVA|nr:hypothetical protein [Haloarcula vallismortis]EMA07657.1 hypothetical protein C437_09443 [Haloarcula vallismortis ATCC 29715]SDW74847.1 hypothetical protein SAMN05443574_106147 [Haloarcula vallismortis]